MSWFRRTDGDATHAASSRDEAEKSLVEARRQTERVNSAVKKAQVTVRQLDEFAAKVNQNGRKP